MSLLNNFGYSTALAAQTLWDSSRRLVYPGLRLGITGLSRSGKTVFTTALIHNLMHHGDLPAFHATAKNTIRRVRLAPQPHVTIPRFPFEDHLNTLCRTRMWPPSTNRISEIRLEIEYENASGWSLNPGYLAVDIVDYPGEWLLDLTLLEKDYRAWSFDVMEAARLPARQRLAAPWLKAVAAVLPRDPADEARAAELCELFKQYLMRLRDGPESVATTPPGRFLMPGDLAGSPALTFFPMDLNSDEPVAESSFAALMQKRFDAYKDHVVKPFFRDHFQRVDRQIVLVDVLAALDGGPTALAELEAALDNVLLAFRIGRRSLFSTLFSPRADKVLFAATKADHLHHESHNRLNAVLRLLVHRAIRRGEASGAGIGTLALASVRATSEKIVTDGGEVLKAVAGVPEAGEQVGDRLFDGETEAVIFPGDLPERPETVFSGAVPPGSLRFPRFRPPAMPPDLPVNAWVPPNIRLDRALEFLIGDYLA